NIMIMGPVNYTNDYRIEKGIGIFVHLSYTHTEAYKGFVATADVFVNIANGAITGDSGNSVPSDSTGSQKGLYVAPGLGYAGGMSLEFSTERWYIHIGYPPFPGNGPDRRVALSMRIGPLSVSTKSYFCVGDDVPPIPPLPREVTAIAGELDLSRDFGQYTNAAGFAFGTDLRLGADGKFLIFYYDLSAGIGFDVNIRKYGDAVCAGGGANAPSIGVNGWYAAGQAWAYATGSIGIDVKLLFVRVRKEILSAGVAAVLQVKGPNPTWARGTFAGYYRILGGLIKGRFRVQAEFGDNCIITGRNGGDPFAEVDVLSGLIPDEDEEEVDVGTSPTAYLILPLNEPSELGAKTYRVRWQETTLREVGGGNVSGTTVREDSTYTIQFVPDVFLEGETEYEIKVKVRLESRPTSGGGWSLVKNEEKVHRFTTAPAATQLAPSNIAYSYPLAGMANFYRNEYDEGYLQLERLQPTLTDDITAVYTRAGSDVGIARPVAFSNNEYTWEHPFLSSDELYKLELVQDYAVAGGGGGGGNTPNTPSQSSLPGMGFGSGPSAPLVAGTAGFTGTVIHTIYFRTSQYATFTAKINGLTQALTHNGSSYKALLTYQGEFMDLYETIGTAQTDSSMVQATVLPNESYTNSSGIRASIINQMPFNFPGVNDPQVWTELRFDLPYHANTFVFADTTAPPPPVEAPHFADGSYPEAVQGGSFNLGFASTTRDLAYRLSLNGHWALEEVIEDLLTVPGIISTSNCFSEAIQGQISDMFGDQ
ncbi:MAG: hypothetical protein AAFZ52_16815, partial [Bacteroidota bacterium]